MLLERSQIQRFADWSGDRNPLHVDEGFAGRTFFGRPLAHGVLAALAALRDSGLGDLASLRTLDVEFRGTVYPGRSYAVESDTHDDALSVTVSEDGEPVLRVTGRRHAPSAPNRPLTPPTPASTVDTAATAQRDEPAVHTLDALTRGLEHQGRFRVPEGDPPTPLGDLEPGLEVVLGLCSYVVGMEIPGLHSLFTRLRLTLHDVEAARETELRYSLATTRLDSRFRLLDTDLTVITTDGRAVAHAELRSYVPFSPADTDIDALARHTAFEGPRPTGQIALVCGGSRGLGADIAAGLALAGYHVYATYRSSKQELTGLAERLTRQGAMLTPVEGDVGDHEWCAETRQTLMARHGRLDVLVLNACAPPRPDRFDAGSASRFESYVSDNLALVERPLSTFLADIDAARGCVVAISSSYVETPPPSSRPT